MQVALLLVVLLVSPVLLVAAPHLVYVRCVTHGVGQIVCCAVRCADCASTGCVAVLLVGRRRAAGC